MMEHGAPSSELMQPSCENPIATWKKILFNYYYILYYHSMSSQLKDESGLLSSLLSMSGPNELEAKKLFRNYIIFCLSFSVTHATVDGVLSYASAELGKSLGGYSGGLLYIFYAFTSLFFSKAFISWKGARISMLIGISSLMMYVTTFSIAIGVPSIQWYVCIPGSIIGGIGAGLMWTAQSTYYSQNALIYSRLSGEDIEKIHNDFAAYFAVIYLGTEALGKSFVTGVYLACGACDNWQLYAFVMYTVVAWLSSAACYTISELGLTNSNLSLNEIISKELTAVFTLTLSHPTFYSLIPYQLSFGLAASYISYYFDGVILNEGGKEGYIGLLSAFAILCAAIIALPASMYSNRFGKRDVMIGGACCFGVCVGVLLFFNNDALSKWAAVIPLFAIYGTGRGVWENTNKAIFADIFTESTPAWKNGDESNISHISSTSSSIGSPMLVMSVNGANIDVSNSEKETAFATIYFCSGFSAAIGFFVYPHMTREEIVIVNVGAALLAIFGNYYICRSISR